MAEDVKSLSYGERKLYLALQRYLEEAEQLVQWAAVLDLPIRSLGAIVLSILPAFWFGIWLGETYLEPSYGDLGLLISLIVVGPILGVTIFDLLSRIMNVGRVVLFGLTNRRLIVAEFGVGVRLKLKSAVTLSSFPLDRIPPISLELKKLWVKVRFHAPEAPLVCTVGRLAKRDRRRIEALAAALEQIRGSSAVSRSA